MKPNDKVKYIGVRQKEIKFFKDDNDITKMIKNGELSSQYKTSQFADLYQEQVCFIKVL